MKILKVEKLPEPEVVMADEAINVKVKGKDIIRQVFGQKRTFTHVAIIELDETDIPGIGYGMGSAIYLEK